MGIRTGGHVWNTSTIPVVQAIGLVVLPIVVIWVWRIVIREIFSNS